MMLPRRLGATMAVSIVLAGCGTPTGFPSPTAPGVSPSTGQTQSPEPAPSRTAGSSATARPSAEIAADPPALALEEVASGLADPINITATPDGWLLVNEREGRVVGVDPSSGEMALALDLTDRVLGGGERGLLGLALHPDWPDTPRAFLHYSARVGDGDTVISEFRGDSPGDGAPVFDPDSERVLITLDQPYANHNGGQLAVGPDGHLYIGLGDGGAGGDPHGNGQDPRTLLGTLLRIDVEVPDDAPARDSMGYGIPSDNPFADGADGAPEVYLYGLRNPWRFSFDRATGELWIADVGQNAFEEINRIDPVADAGANLGWNRMEASHCFVAGCSTDGLLLPLAEYGRDLGCSVTGGHVYRGTAIDELTGWYLFGDACSGLVFGVPSDAEPPAAGETVEPRLLLETDASISSFGEGADGELYLADLGSGSIYRIVAAGG